MKNNPEKNSNKIKTNIKNKNFTYKTNSNKKNTEKKTTTKKQNINTKQIEIKKTNQNNIVYRKVKIKKLNKKNLFLLILILIAFITLIISIINLINWMFDNKNINKQVNEIIKVTKIETIVDTDNTEIIEQENIDKSDPYWDYIKINLIDVNFEELTKTNNETQGWIQVNGTNVNYPFVQTKDNDYYLTHSFDKSYNGGGWVFLDYRNNLSNNDKNTIIYGHGRQNKTIFGTLKDTLNENWYKNTDNHIIKLSTKYENTLWQIFTIYRIPTTNDYIRINFNTDEEYSNWLKLMQSRSIHNFNTNISSIDKVLTLSTCYNNDDKVVIQAKLIKREIKN